MIKAKGIVKQKIEQDAYVLLTVKYGLIRLISTKADLCEQIGNVDLKCPVEAGEVEITKTVDLPAEIPPVCESSLLLPSLFLIRSRANILFWPTSSPPMMSKLPVSRQLSLSLVAARAFSAAICN